MIGKVLGHYQITGQLGRGGMGEVYRGHDTKLNRDIALKILPSEFAKDPERMGRFKREAQLLASLNHPNIAGIYGLEESEGVTAIAMELAEGQTLAESISGKPIPFNEALSIAAQIAEALEAAHEKGIIHRDLKPANIKVTAEGTVKVLDFGLAKVSEGESAEEDGSKSPTLSMAATRAGIILGTAAYMAPEQARGSGVDRRCDIWSFGVVFFEMLAGKRLFEGETISDTLAAILRAEVDWKLLPKGIPATIRALLGRCLTRDRRQRLQAIGEARISISDYVANPVESFEASAEIPEFRFEITTPPAPAPASFAISPDGRYLVFSGATEGEQRLLLRPLSQLTAQPLLGTEGATLPFWSPDSRSIGFFAETKLKRIDIAGGLPQVIAGAILGAGGAWNHDGIIVYAPSALTPLYRVASSGGDPAAATVLDPPHQVSHAFPQFLPDGRHFLFSSRGADPGIYLASLDSAETRRLISAEMAAYAPPGYLLFIRQGTLFAMDFDAARGEPVGDMVRIADSAAFSVSRAGILAYRTSGGTELRQLTWFDRSGKEVGTLGALDGNNLRYPELSPDGRRVAISRTVHGNTEIWLSETVRGVPLRFTFDAQNLNPVWSPDGNWIAFASFKRGIADLYRKASSSSGSGELLLNSPYNEFPLDWSPDGRFLLFVRLDPSTGGDLWVLPLSGEGKPFPFINASFESDNGQFSPDGQWVAYESNESGRVEVYVQPFPDGGGKWMISTAGGIAPRWRRDGRELFYVAPDSKLMAVPIRSAAQNFKAGTPVPLFPTRIVFGGTSVRNKHQYTVAPTGRRFLINTAADESTTPITVVTNLSRTLRK